jgi:hypothetical protein
MVWPSRMTMAAALWVCGAVTAGGELMGSDARATTTDN